ncbi:hypothetical protein ILYODFUR_009493 [Ilyodon furcidens]|uniref:Secreted protein n=1 Tax=Ilyodon furcidens TaxID=33524 RepID=A0ABV0UHJ8_9TELE
MYSWISASVFFLCLCSVLSNSWKEAVYTELASAGRFFLLKRSFPLHCRYMHTQYEGLLQSQCQRLSTVSTCSSGRSECCKSLTRCNLLGLTILNNKLNLMALFDS